MTVAVLFSQNLMASSSSPALDLRATIQYAFEHSQTFATQHRELTISRLETRSAFARLLPSLDLSASVGRQQTEPATQTSPYTSGLTLTLTENLYDNGASLTGLRQSRVLERIANLRFAKERDQLILDIAEKFVALQLARRLEEARQTQLSLIQRQYKTIGAQYRSGLKTRKDFLRIEADLRRGEIDLASTRNNTRLAHENLLTVIGAPSAGANSASGEAGTLTFVAPEAHPKRDIDVPTQSPSLENHYEARIVELERESSHFDTELVRRKYWPEVNVTLSATRSYTNFVDNPAPIADTASTRAEAMLTLTYNLWDWGIRRRNLEIARAREAIKVNTAETQILTLRSQLNQLMRGLTVAKETDRLSFELLTLEEQGFDFIENQYREGRVQYLDLNRALDSLLDAKSRFFTARSELETALLRYRYHEGTLYDHVSH